MIQLTTHMCIFVATSPLDMRKGIDGVALVCRTQLGSNPMSGAVFGVYQSVEKDDSVVIIRWTGLLACDKKAFAGAVSFLAIGGGC